MKIKALKIKPVLMKRFFFIALLSTTCLVATPTQPVKAALPAWIVQVIKKAVKKGIKAVDLMIQRMQNKVIVLQNAQKILENKLSELKLTEIAEWTEKHRQLFARYYEELWTIKNAIATYQEIQQIMKQQQRIVDEYNRAWRYVQQDENFSPGEIAYMYRVYSGMLRQGLYNLDRLETVVNAFTTQMTDAQRLAIIHQVRNEMDKTYYDLVDFNQQNYALSIERTKGRHEIDVLKKLYNMDP